MARLTILRVTQEALTNVIKHADPAGPVQLSIARRDGGAEFGVDSVGVDEQQGGLGVIGMSARMDLCGGTFAAGRSEQGRKVRARLHPSCSPMINAWSGPDWACCAKRQTGGGEAEGWGVGKEW